MSQVRRCVVELPASVTLEYDHQTDTLYILLSRDEQPSEEILSEDSSVVFGLKDNRLVFISILNFSKKLEESSL
ncbi:MAG: DUF2283 domain-containing protein [Desulfurococcaceae archaeon]